MSDTPPPSDNRDLLKKIDTKLAWALLLLFFIMLNTCELVDDVEDAVRDRAAAPAAQSQES